MSYYNLYKKYKQKYLNVKLSNDMIGGVIESDKDEYLDFKIFYQKQVDRYYNTYDEVFNQYCKKCMYTPDIIHVKPNQKVYCLGDIHGDFDVLFSCLVEAGLVSEQTGKWIGGSSILIQLGDMLDGTRDQAGNTSRFQNDAQLNSGVPYEGESKIVNYLKYLHLEAIEHGGMVVTCFGNHDISRLLAKYSDNGTVAEKVYIDPLNMLPYQLRIDQYKREGLIAPSVSANQQIRTIEDQMNYNNLFTEPHYLGSLNDIGSASYLYMNTHNKKDFSYNKSLGPIDNPNEYPAGNGYHRQLLASCASKLMVKLKWDRTNGDGPLPIGILCSHGEKFHDYFVHLKYYIINSISSINQYYSITETNGINTDQIDNNHDLIIIFINSIFSFFLRKYNQKPINPDPSEDLFRKLVIRIVRMCNGADPDQGPNSFIWGRPPHNGSGIEIDQYCKKTSDSLTFFRLDPQKSSCISAHSGPLGTGIIPINEHGVCKPTAIMYNSVHQNTAIMTDVMASMAFKTNSDIENRGNPQLVKIFLVNYHSALRYPDPMLKFELITSTDSSFDIDNDDYKPIDISEKYRTHNISKPSLSDKIVNIPIDKLETDQIPDSTSFVGFPYDPDSDSDLNSVYEVHSNRNLISVGEDLDQLQQINIPEVESQDEQAVDLI